LDQQKYLTSWKRVKLKSKGWNENNGSLFGMTYFQRRKDKQKAACLGVNGAGIMLFTLFR